MTQNKQNVPAVLQELALQIPDEYLVTEFLGEGGHGIVLKAMQKTMQKNVALKIIKTDNSEDTQKQLKRMQNEAKILARLEHPNIVKVFQMCACKDGTPFLVCEYLEGITLAQYLMSNPQPSPQAIYQIFTQILEALELAHANNLLHRDIKPSNVMLLKDADVIQIKLLDFGIAREFEASEMQPLGLTRTIQLSGSAPYMSPEQCKGMKIDQRSDLYSVACMLFECLSGKPPFFGETPMHTRYLQIHEAVQIPEIDKYKHTSSRSAVYKLALQCLSKDVNDRPSSAHVFKDLLQKAMPNALKRSNWTLRKERAQPWRMAGLLAGLFLVSIAGLWLSNHQLLSDFLHKSDDYPKNTTPRKTTKSSAHSVLNRLRDAQDRMKLLGNSQTPDDLKERMALYDQVCRCIAEINPAKKGTLCTALSSRAALERSMNLPQAAFNTTKSELALCKDKQGRETFEAVNCYVKLAASCIELGKLAEAQQYLQKGFALDKEMDSDRRALEVPPIIDAREAQCKWALHMQQAAVFERQGKAAESADEYHEVAKIKLEQDKLAEAAESISSEAILRASLGQSAAAEKLLKEFYDRCMISPNTREALLGLEKLERCFLFVKDPALQASIRESKQQLKSGL